MLTVKQAAERLGISASLVYGLCAAGKLRHERFGLGRGCIRISEEALLEFREDCQGTGTAKIAAPFTHTRKPFSSPR